MQNMLKIEREREREGESGRKEEQARKENDNGLLIFQFPSWSQMEDMR